jgi:hypothetical protein
MEHKNIFLSKGMLGTRWSPPTTVSFEVINGTPQEIWDRVKHEKYTDSSIHLNVPIMGGCLYGKSKLRDSGRNLSSFGGEKEIENDNVFQNAYRELVEETCGAVIPERKLDYAVLRDAIKLAIRKEYSNGQIIFVFLVNTELTFEDITKLRHKMFENLRNEICKELCENEDLILVPYSEMRQATENWKKYKFPISLDEALPFQPFMKESIKCFVKHLFVE